MELIYYCRSRFKGISIEKIKETLYENYKNKDKISIHSLQLDHVVPFSISADNSTSNLQLLTKREHNIKTGKDKKIIKLFRDKGWIEKITHYSHELKRDKSFLIDEYFKELNTINTFHIQC